MIRLSLYAHCAFLRPKHLTALLRVVRREFGAEQHQHAGVVDPHQDHGERAGGAEWAPRFAVTQIETDYELRCETDTPIPLYGRGSRDGTPRPR